MSEPLVLVTGFGPFPGMAENPSREVARLLQEQPPAGVTVVAAELPVTFAGAPEAVAAAVGSLSHPPAALLGLGVQPEPTLRLERRARGRLAGERADNDGAIAEGIDAGPDLATTLDLEALAAGLRAAGTVSVSLSEDAGGYVCERTYHALLSAAAPRGIPALFLHIPPAEILSPADQAPLVRALLEALLRQVSSSSEGRSSAD